MGIGAFFGRMFGTEKAMDTAVGAVRDGLDALVYTDEEKAGDAAKERTEARSMLIEWMRTTQGQNLTRRFIAVSFTLMFFLLLLSGIGVSISAVWVADPTALNATAEILFRFLEEIGMTYSVIIAFYFAAPHMSSLTKAYIDNKTKG